MSKALVPIPAGALAIAGDEWSRAAYEWLANFQSERTRTTYAAAWGDFLNRVGKHPGAVVQGDVIAYRDTLSAEGLSAATVAMRLAALASFYAHARRAGLVEGNPARDVKRPKVRAYTAARWLTQGEAAEVLASIGRDSLEGLRDYAIVVCMFTMGLRLAEVAGLQIGALADRGDGSLELRYKPKGGEEQSRPVPAAAARAIRAYLAARGDPDSGPVFAAHDRALASRGTAGLSREAIRLLVARRTYAALGRELNPHALRHTAAGVAWDVTHDLRKVQHLLGHSSATTTERYLHRRDDERGALGDALAVAIGAE